MNDCPATGKVAYDTKLEALKARAKINARVRRSNTKRRVYERDPYLCSACRAWHLTSSPQ